MGMGVREGKEKERVGNRVREEQEGREGREWVGMDGKRREEQ